MTVAEIWESYYKIWWFDLMKLKHFIGNLNILFFY